jgi:hypothetical protein
MAGAGTGPAVGPDLGTGHQQPETRDLRAAAVFPNAVMAVALM